MKRKNKDSAKLRGTRAFLKGKAAYEANHPLDANPYEQGQPSAYAWSKGWLEAMKTKDSSWFEAMKANSSANCHQERDSVKVKTQGHEH